jgi:dipeptidyl aminopeptidase/acylaminoacyl peptidase
VQIQAPRPDRTRNDPESLLQHAVVVHPLIDQPDEVLMGHTLDAEFTPQALAYWKPSRLTVGLYRVNTRTGKITTEVKDPEMTVDWLCDRRGRARVAVSLDRAAFDDGFYWKDRTQMPALHVYWINDDGSAERIDGIQARVGEEFAAIGVEASGDAFLFRARQQGDRAAVWRYSRTTRQITGPIVENARVDLGGPLASPLDAAASGVFVPEGRGRVHYLEPAFAKLQPTLDEALSEFVNTITSWDRTGQRLMIVSRSAREPGRFYLFDQKTQELNAVFYRGPWLNEWNLAETEPVTIAARDGVPLDCYLTRPPGAQARRKLPLILLVHGGPFGVRDIYEFQPEVQFLATRGYAVLQVNYRGSGGFGAAFEQLAVNQIGLKMQDDLTDAVQWAVAQGIADPARLAIMGSSYGGYAVLRAVTREPELFKIGVAMFAPSDLPRQLGHYRETPEYSYAYAFWSQRVGDAEKDRARLEQVSPVHAVSQIRVPLFIVYGDNDPRIPYAQSADFVRALRAAKKDFVRYAPEGEGHGIADEKARVKTYETLEKFLAQRFPAS